MEFLSDWPIWKFMLVASLWGPPLVLVHELGHAFTALDLTRGRVLVVVGRGPALRLRMGRLALALSGFGPGKCAYEPRTLVGPARSEAWILAAGPLTSLMATVALALPASASGGTAHALLGTGAICSGLSTFISALPMRYGRGLGGGESDGMGIWRILTGRRPGRAPKPDRGVARPAFLVVLALVTVLAFVVDPLLGLGVVGLLGFALWSQTREAR